MANSNVSARSVHDPSVTSMPKNSQLSRNCKQSGAQLSCINRLGSHNARAHIQSQCEVVRISLADHTAKPDSRTFGSSG
jgi:hypothetical protein